MNIHRSWTERYGWRNVICLVRHEMHNYIIKTCWIWIWSRILNNIITEHLYRHQNENVYSHQFSFGIQIFRQVEKLTIWIHLWNKGYWINRPDYKHGSTDLWKNLIVFMWCVESTERRFSRMQCTLHTHIFEWNLYTCACLIDDTTECNYSRKSHSSSNASSGNKEPSLRQ